MSATKIILKVSEEVSATTAVADSSTPANGSTLLVTDFIGQAAFSKNAVVKVVWQYNHASLPEIIIWSTKGSDHMILNEIITDCDGVKKIAVVCDNGDTGALVLSGLVNCWERT